MVIFSKKLFLFIFVAFCKKTNTFLSSLDYFFLYKRHHASLKCPWSLRGLPASHVPNHKMSLYTQQSIIKNTI